MDHHAVFVTAPLPSPNWQPSPVRTIAVPTQTNLRARSLVPLAVTLSWAPKSSADNLDFTLDPTAWLAGTGDYLLAPVATVPSSTGLPTDLTVLFATLLNGMAVIHLGGGAPGTTQQVLVALTTQQGRRQSLLVTIAITNDSEASLPGGVPTTVTGYQLPPNAVQLPDGSILTLGSGVPLIIG